MKVNMKKLCSVALAAAIGFGVIFSDIHADAMSREDIAKISVNKGGSNFKYWNKDSAAKQELVKFVKDITKKKSPNFVPVEDRIAVFDMDGTFISETTPYYFEWMLYLDQIELQKDKLSEEMLNNGAIVKEAVDFREVTDEIDALETKEKLKILAGMDREGMRKAVQYTMDQPATGMANMNRGESFYLPMVEVMSFLKANDFTLYVVSGADRDIIRYAIDGVLPIPMNNVIGADVTTELKNKKGVLTNKDDFKLGEDELVRGDTRVTGNTHMLKVVAMNKEIFKQPILAFGNSTGDTSMLNYTLTNNQYKSMSFALLCDDISRDYGNLVKAANMKQICDENGWISVSMNNDWKTIYGEDVVRMLR